MRASSCILSLSQGSALLENTQFNKGSAFPTKERDAFKLHGLLPPNIQTLDEQVRRAYEQYSSRPDELSKNTFMASMKAQNEVLYYKVSLSDLFQIHMINWQFSFCKLISKRCSV